MKSFYSHSHRLKIVTVTLLHMLTFFKKVAKIQFSFVCHTNFVIFYYLALTGHLTQCVKTLSLFRDRAKKTDNIVTKAVTTIRNRV